MKSTRGCRGSNLRLPHPTLSSPSLAYPINDCPRYNRDNTPLPPFFAFPPLAWFPSTSASFSSPFLPAFRYSINSGSCKRRVFPFERSSLLFIRTPLGSLDSPLSCNSRAKEILCAEELPTYANHLAPMNSLGRGGVGRKLRVRQKWNRRMAGEMRGRQKLFSFVFQFLSEERLPLRENRTLGCIENARMNETRGRFDGAETSLEVSCITLWLRSEMDTLFVRALAPVAI